MNYRIFNAECDLGVHVDGSNLGPKEISDNFDFKVSTITKKNITKSLDKNDLAKNLDDVNEFNEKLYKSIVKCDDPVITIGGDHVIAIASALASIKKYENLGIIWIDSHGDFNNFDTTITGNLHGLPFASVTNYKDTNKLTSFHTGDFYKFKNAILVGARDVDKLEMENLKDAGITIFTTDDINRLGAKEVMEQAILLAARGTNGVHISYDIDVIDPNIAPGVSVPAINGINLNQAFEIMHTIKNNEDIIKSLDLVEYNPTLDKNSKTLDIAINLLNIYTKKRD